MAKIVLKDAYVNIGGTVASDHCSEVTIDDSKDEVDVTAFGSTNKEILTGIGDASITLSVFNDYAAGALDSILWPIHKNDTPTLIEIRPTSGARSTSNPAYTMTGVLPAYSPIAGGVGAASTTSVAFRNSTQTGVQRLTS